MLESLYNQVAGLLPAKKNLLKNPTVFRENDLQIIYSTFVLSRSFGKSACLAMFRNHINVTCYVFN